MMFKVYGLVLGLVASCGVASAQGPAIPSPTYSPYLNLFRQGNPLFQNYYGLVKPQQQAYQALNGLQQQLSATQASAYTAGGGSEFATGHASSYFTHRSYFLTRGAGGSTGFATRGTGTGGTLAGNNVNLGANAGGNVGGGGVPRR